MSSTAKLFMNGRSQAVRLPREFRFDDCDKVYIRKDPDTGDIIISKKPDSWDGFFELLEETDVPDDFLLDRDASLPVDRDPPL